jgi:outer membrane protein OmpA-like peptidoglycan-associated protein
MKGKRKHQLAAASVVVVLISLAGGAATSAATTRAVVRNASCTTTETTTTANDKHVVAVLSDSAADTSTKATRNKAMDAVLNAGFADHARLLIDSMTTNAGALPVNMRLEAMGNNQLLQDHDRTCKGQTIKATLTKLMSTRSTERPVFRAINGLANHLSGLTATSIDVMLFSNLLNTTPELNLTDPNLLSTGASALLSRATNAGLLPSCTGWRVYAVGPGTRVAGVTLTQAQQAVVRDFWSQFFQACGGALVSYDSDLVTYPVTKTRPVVQRTAGTIRTTLPADVLFAVDAAELSPEAIAFLGDVVTTIQQSHPTALVVEGNTDSTGSDDHNRTLSVARAQAVANWLVARGVPQQLITVNGLGSSRPLASNNDPVGRQRNRRVEIILTVPQ